MLRHDAVIIRAALAIAFALFDSRVRAGSLPPIAFLSIGFRGATLMDFRGSEQEGRRQSDANNFLAVTADFNDDGQADEARILINRQDKVAYVVAVIQSRTKIDTFVLKTLALRDAVNVGIALAPPRLAGASRRAAGVAILALDSGQGEARFIDGEDFGARVNGVLCRAPTGGYRFAKVCKASLAW